MFDITTTVERNGYPSTQDTGKTKSALRQLGYYAEDDEDSPYPNNQMYSGLMQFQSDQGLKKDGRMKPDGETAHALNVAQTKPPKKPKTAPKPEKKPDPCAAQKTAYENAQRHVQYLKDSKRILLQKINRVSASVLEIENS